MLLDSVPSANAKEVSASLFAYVGTFSSPLKDVLPTQVDLPPGNGLGIHLFQVDRDTGVMTPAGVHEMGTSPSCLALNASGTRLYSANETDRHGKDKEGTISAFAVNRMDGKLELLNTVLGGAGPTYVVSTVGRFVGGQLLDGSVAVLPILDDGIGHATTQDDRKLGPKATNAREGRLRHQRSRPDTLSHDPGRSSGRFVLCGLGWKIFV